MLAKIDNKSSNSGGGGDTIQRGKLLKEYTKSEKDLKTELQQLELARKQYVHTCKHEIQKVILRYTNRIAKHNFYFDSTKHILNPDAEVQQQKNSTGFDSDSFVNQSFLTNSRLSTSTNRRDSGSGFKTPATGVNTATPRNSFSAAGRKDSFDKNRKTSNGSLAGKPPTLTAAAIAKVAATNSASTSKNNSNQLKSANTNKTKKNVSWNTASFNNDPPPNTLDDDDYIDYHKRPAKQVGGGGSRLSTTSTRKSISGTSDYDPSENINQFLESLKNSNSGFHSYKNSKGEAVCAGYDNFANLNRFNSASTSSIRSPLQPTALMSRQQSSRGGKTVVNHFENPFETFVDFKNRPRQKGKNFDNDDEFLKSSLLFTESSIFSHNSKKNSVASSPDHEIETDEHRQLFAKLLKASNTRSLTMKNILV